MSKFLNEVRALVAKVDAGELSEAGFTSRMLVIAAKARPRVTKQSANSLLPAEVRMGCSKKGYTRPSAH